MSFSSEDATNYFGLPLLLLLTFGTIFLCRRMSELPEREKTTREHGITYPWDKWQIIVVTATIYNIFVFFGVASRAIDDQIGWCFIYGLFLVITICLWLYMSLMDPCIGKTEEPLGNEYWCRFCQSYFDGEKRKHCRHCKKCVLGFDHHCFFLNTCVADHNYKAFISLLSCFILLLLLQLVSNALAIAEHLDSADSAPFSDVAVYIFLFSSLLLSLPMWMGACALMCLHLYFMLTGTNTFKWLKQDYEEEKLRVRLAAYEMEMARGIEALGGGFDDDCSEIDEVDQQPEPNVLYHADEHQAMAEPQMVRPRDEAKVDAAADEPHGTTSGITKPPPADSQDRA